MREANPEGQTFQSVGMFARITCSQTAGNLFLSTREASTGLDLWPPKGMPPPQRAGIIP